MAKTASLPDVNQMDDGLKAVLLRLTNGYTTSMVGYRRRLQELAEEYLVPIPAVEARLAELLGDQLQPLLDAGRFIEVKKLLGVIPIEMLDRIDRDQAAARADARQKGIPS